MQVFFRRYQVSRILRAANAYKLRGVPVLSIFLLVFRMVFQQRSVYTQMHLQRTAMPFGKDTSYRFMNSCRIHWRRFTTELAAAIIHATLAPLTQADRINVLILDDSIYHRARSKKVELLARLYDHAKKEFSYGFRMLTLCWSDGNTLLPVSHTLLSTENTKNRLPVRLVFVRNRNHRKDWLVLVTTGMSLTAEEVIRIYGKRWGIEVFFKVCKSFLRLEKDCRSLSYDAMTAHVSIVFTRYMFLAVELRECKDARSLGELFYLSVDELADVCFVEVMRLLLLLFVERLQEKPVLDEGEIHEQLQGFLKELPVLLSQKLRKCA